MIAALRRSYARFRGFDTDGSVVPAMDGPLSPNARLDEAVPLGLFPGLDNLVAVDGALLASQGETLVSLRSKDDRWSAIPLAHFERPIASLAGAPDGGLAIGLDGDGLRIRGGRFDGLTVRDLAGRPLLAPTALCFEDAGTLLIAGGSAAFTAANWARDLMTQGCSGSLWRLSLETGEAQLLADGLAFPSGIATQADGVIYLSEAWRHRILRLSPGGERQVALDQLPAYPGRIAPTPEGFWLALFAPRNPLVDFVLKEPAYRQRMIREIDPALWIAPRLRSGTMPHAPLQAGGARKLNTLKPWSPSWSYGLVLHCDPAMRPLASYHSRADGGVHGVTALLPQGGLVMVAAKGAGLLLRLDPQARAEEQRA